MITELDITWKDVVVVYFKEISRHLPGGVEENY
jgi:hypothetical protein